MDLRKETETSRQPRQVVSSPEMLRRKPLLPGKNTQHQLNLIVEHLGFPDSETIARKAFERLSERAFEAEFG